MASVKKNIILNGINTISGIIFPVITFPYAARILSPDGIGAVNFLNSVISYIILLTSLGIPLYAVKEIAKYRDDKQNRDKVTVEIILLTTALCLLGYIGVWLLARFVPQIHSQSGLFYLLSLSIVFNSLGVNWFYQGIEDFKFITIRAIIIRTISAAALFIFVKNHSDLLYYGMIIVASTVGNNILNFIHLRKHISFSNIRFRELNFTRHISPALQVFAFNLITSLYIQLNSVMLGFISGDTETGYFTAGTKITHIALTFIVSIGTVMLPRCSHLLKSGDMESFSSVINKSLRLTLGLSLPICFGLILLATPVTVIFCGAEYIPAIPVVYFNAPVIIFISITNVMGIQILFPMDKIRLVIWSVSGGAAVNLILNFMLIPSYGAIGAAISTFFAELAVLLIQVIWGKKYYPFKISALFQPSYIIATLTMTCAVAATCLITDDTVMQLTFGTISGVVVYFGTLTVIKDSLCLEMLSAIKKKL